MLSLLILLSAAQAQPSFDKPAWARFANPGAADHVAVMRVRRGWGPPGEDRATITRSGRWLREDVVEAGKRSTSISDLRSATSYHYTREGDRYASLVISGRRGAVRLAVEKTRQTDHLLGEACTVWLFEADSYTEKNCLTADGILLWQSIVGKNGGELSSARAISIARRPVRPREVQPPADLLRLDSWRTAPGGSSMPNDEVVLRAPPDPRGRAESLDIRRLGSTVVTDHRSARGRTRTFSGQGMTLTLDEQPDGALDRLGIARTPRGAGTTGPFGKPVRPAPGTKTILGETCTMFDLAPGVSDFAQTECRTRDGLVLERSTWTRGSGTTLTAASIARGRVRPADVAPPRNILEQR